MGVDLAKRLDWATSMAAAKIKRDWWMGTLIRAGLGIGHTIVIVPVEGRG